MSPDAELHHLPFELLLGQDSRRLLDTHAVSYAPSGSVLSVLRSETRRSEPSQQILAISASPSTGKEIVPSAKAVSRNVYDLDPSKLRPLPAADDEARSVGRILDPEGATVLLGARATESEFKRQPLAHFDVLHFAVHGIPSTKFPARGALLLHPGGNDDGVLQAREILMLPLKCGARDARRLRYQQRQRARTGRSCQPGASIHRRGGTNRHRESLDSRRHVQPRPDARVLPEALSRC